MVAERYADVTWEGNLVSGHGKFTTGSGALGEKEVTWASRTERSEGKTSPEELLAAAQGSCFAMAFSSALAKNGTPPDRLEIKATCTFDQAAGKVSSMKLDVVGFVPGLAEEKFVALAEEKGQNCPIAKAIVNNVVEITVTARLGKK